MRQAGAPVRSHRKPPRGSARELIRDCGAAYILGQLTTQGVSWIAVSRWMERERGIYRHEESIRRAVLKYGQPRKRRQPTLPVPLLEDAMQLLIVMRLHGVYYPWRYIADQAWAKHQVVVNPRRISQAVLSYYGLRS
jgi:hypothetical protein